MRSNCDSILPIQIHRRLGFAAFLLLAVSAIGFTHYATSSVRDVSAVDVSTVSAASFEPAPVSSESIVSSFGVGLATQTATANDADPSRPGIQLPTVLGGTTVEVNGSRAGLFFVSAGQVNYAVPAATQSGVANVVVRAGDGTISNGTMQVAQVAPSIFTANANGRGVPAASLLRVKANGQQTFETISQFNQASGSFITKPIDLGPAGERVFLILFLTGLRHAEDTNNDGNFNESVRVLLGGDTLTPFFAGVQPDFVGLEQINLELPRTLIGRGIVNLFVNAPGFLISNSVEIQIGAASGGAPPQINGFDASPALAGQELAINGGGFSSVMAENTVRIAGSDATVVMASPSQLRVLVPFGVQSGPVSVRTPQGESTSSSALAIRTSISGLIENTARQPLGDVTLRITDLNLSVKTNSEGCFVLPDVPPETYFVEVDGGTIGVNPPYPRVILRITALPARDNQFSRPIALQQSTGASGTIGTGSSLNSNEAEAASADLQSQQQVVIQTGGFQLEVPANSAARFPNGNTRGPITLTPLLNGRTPVNLPFGYFSAGVVQITPFNVNIALGAKLTFPNLEALPAGTKLDVFRYDSMEGAFIREKEMAQVSPDGRLIETAPSAVKITNFYFAAILRQTTTVTGRVFEKNGNPASHALVSVRGQEAFTDGTGTYVLRKVPVRDAESITVDVSFIRSLLRTERIQSEGASAVINGITKIPDVILPGSGDNRPPVVIAPAKLELEEGKTYDVLVVVTDPDLGQSIETSVTGANFASLIKGVGNIHTLRLAPNFQQSGERTLTLSATDSAGGTTKHDIAVSVKDINRAPTAASQSVALDQNGSVTIRLEGNDPDGDPLTYKLVSPPAHGALTGTPPNLTYRSNTNYTGPDSLTFRVNDGSLESDTATVSINVRSVNRAPVVTVPGPQSTTENKALIFTVTATDPDAGQTLMFSTAGVPAGATVVAGTASNSLIFRWTPSFIQAGTYTVSFTATDNGSPQQRDTKSVQIVITDVPVLVVPGTQRVTQGTTVSFSVTTSQAAAGIPVTLSASNLPPGANVDPAGSTLRFVWRTTVNTPTGNYVVTFRALNTGAPAVNESRTVTITVDPIIIGRQ